MFDFFEYIVGEISSERLSGWIAESKLDKTILLNKLDYDFIYDWLMPNPNKGKPMKIKNKPKEE